MARGTRAIGGQLVARRGIPKAPTAREGDGGMHSLWSYQVTEERTGGLGRDQGQSRVGPAAAQQCPHREMA